MAETLREGLGALRVAIEDEEAAQRARIDAVLPRHRASAINLAHYLGLRKRDLRRLQRGLAALGLSSLGRYEGHVRDALQRVNGWLTGARRTRVEGLDAARAAALLRDNAQALFGPPPADRHVYIMVTAPPAAEANAAWADALLEAGADVLRINGAHESPEQWAALCTLFKKRAAARGRPGRVMVDLPGPKMRAEIRDMQERVLRFRRGKDRFGRTVVPARVALVGQWRKEGELPVPSAWIGELRAGDRLQFEDAAGRHRTLVVRSRTGEAAFAECARSLYVRSGLALTWRRGRAVLGRGSVGALPREPRELLFRPGDAFVLNAAGKCLRSLPALALPEREALQALRPGQRVILDDGRILATAEAPRGRGMLCRVLRTAKTPARLRSGKGVALPDTPLSLGRLGPQDEAALAFALEHADGVEVSFVASARDVALVGERIRASGRIGFGMVLKLESLGAMRNLPAILFEAMKYHPVGMMIARGDLAVELSFERLAEMQEELLWFGEACHLPVIWATQVLDSMAHSGIPTRAEVTDAAMSMRAECVMLNRGPHSTAAVRMLADIIRKMETHQYKKRSLSRRLDLACT